MRGKILVMTLASGCLRRKFAVALLAAACPWGASEAQAAPAGTHRAEVAEITALTHNVKRIRLKAANPGGFSFEPGQFVLLKLPQSYLDEFNGKYGTSHANVSRPYSLASSPSELPYFDLIIKHYPAPRGKDVPPGLASSYVHEVLAVGDAVEFTGPVGSLYQAGNSTDPLIVVAGGVGASPFVGLLKYWFEEGVDQKRKIYFFFGARSKRDLLLHGQFEQWASSKKNFTYVPALSAPAERDQWQGETGYINLVLDRYFEKLPAADVYLAGAPIMVRETIKVLHAKGLRDERIHHDPIEVH
jgi:Na+-transporting NADH:ubiquinone oxidoreductase subunit F